MKIDVNIPVPPATDSMVRTIEMMEVGHSFTVPVTRRKSLSYTLWHHKQKPCYSERAYVTRTVTESDQSVVRCWRTA